MTARRRSATQPTEPRVRIVCADVLEGLRGLPDGSVHCVVTSPPYWGLRDYGTATWVGGDPECDHVQFRRERDFTSKEAKRGGGPRDSLAGSTACRKCGARRVDSQIGLEESPQAYVDRLVEVLREVRRVLRDDGTFWLNLGDSYNGAGREGHGTRTGYKQGTNRASAAGADGPRPNARELKSKDLAGTPWRVAFALQADGWYLRQDIIWSKPNPMPESVTDRCTKAHEYIFLLTKSARYYYDAEAIAEKVLVGDNGSSFVSEYDRQTKPGLGLKNRRDRGGSDGRVDFGMYSGMAGDRVNGTRNKRSVWTVASQPYTEAYFATFPPALIEPCILAGTSARGCCAARGAPWRRIVERKPMVIRRSERTHILGRTRSSGTVEDLAETRTVGWEPTCGCCADVAPATVLDPFGGAGTTALVASRNNRSAVHIDLSADYCAMAAKRLRDDAPFLAHRVEYV